ncbi:MAG: ABC transporter permease [Candidatus Bathyarchaeota archaeon]|nr:ABC transporter permease [Candidatus Bathyarchaeota archaeon]
MVNAGTEYSLRGIVRQLVTYKSGIFGIVFLILLVSLSIYAVVAIPYEEAIKLWRGEDAIWIENPRNAQPYWVRYFGKNLPETIKRDTSQAGRLGTIKVLTPVPERDLRLLYISFSFGYSYDDFPSEINVFFSAKYNGSAPLLKIYWIKPGGTEIELLSYIPRNENDRLSLSINSRVSSRLYAYTVSVLGGNPQVPLLIEQAMFAVEDETMNSTITAKPLKGTYKFIIDGILYGEDSDLDAKIVIYGKVHGLAGTDNLRRDLTIALLWGTPIAFAFGLIASLTISFLQLLLATVSGYYGGRIDSVIQRVTEGYMILPFLPFLIMIATFYKLDIWVLLLVIIFLSIFGGGVKSTRALVMQIKEYPYIEAARAYGASSKRIILLYIIPKILPPIVPGLIGSVPGYVFLEAALSLLGLGDPYLPSWGKVIQDSYAGGALYKGYYYWVLEPAFMLILTAFAFSFLGFALDKIVNPKLREV